MTPGPIVEPERPREFNRIFPRDRPLDEPEGSPCVLIALRRADMASTDADGSIIAFIAALDRVRGSKTEQPEQ